MGAIPGWIDYIDPDYIDASAPWVRNRSVANSKYGANATPVLGTFPNGQKSFSQVEGSGYGIYSDPLSQSIDPTQWSIFTTCIPGYVSSELNENVIVRGNSSNVGPELGLRVALTRSSGYPIVREFSSGTSGSGSTSNPSRLTVNVNLINRTVPSFVMFTFSTRDGLRIFIDGALAGSAPTDKRPIQVDLGPEQRSFFRGVRGSYGVTGILNTDLGWEEHTGYRRAIEKFMFDKYGISA